MTRASEFSSSVRWQAFKRCLDADGKPHCEVCGSLIRDICEYDHKKPLGLGGDSSLDNCSVTCRTCHRMKTHGEDRPIMAKADRQRKAAAGVKRKHKWPKRRFGQ